MQLSNVFRRGLAHLTRVELVWHPPLVGSSWAHWGENEVNRITTICSRLGREFPRMEGLSDREIYENYSMSSTLMKYINA